MGCSFSGLNSFYDAVNGAGDVWINENRFRIVRQLGEGGFAFVFLVKEVVADGAAGLARKKSINPSHVSDDGTYAMKKVIIQTEEQLEMVKQEIRVSSLFSHPNLLPLLDHAIIPVKGTHDISRKHEAYLLFPVHLDGTLLDIATIMQSKKESFTTTTVLQIFRQLCAGLKHMHSFDPPYAHNDVKPGNVLITHRKGQPPLAILMDFGSARPARKEIRSRSEALQLQEWASEHCSAPFRAPELWDCPSHADIDERTDIWSLGCTLYAIMYGTSPFEYALGESGGSLQLAVMNAQIKWPSGHNPPYPEMLPDPTSASHPACPRPPPAAAAAASSCPPAALRRRHQSPPPRRLSTTCSGSRRAPRAAKSRWRTGGWRESATRTSPRLPSRRTSSSDSTPPTPRSLTRRSVPSTTSG